MVTSSSGTIGSDNPAYYKQQEVNPYSFAPTMQAYNFQFQPMAMTPLPGNPSAGGSTNNVTLNLKGKDAQAYLEKQQEAQAKEAKLTNWLTFGQNMGAMAVNTMNGAFQFCLAEKFNENSWAVNEMAMRSNDLANELKAELAKEQIKLQEKAVDAEVAIKDIEAERDKELAKIEGRTKIGEERVRQDGQSKRAEIIAAHEQFGQSCKSFDPFSRNGYFRG